MSWWSHQAQVPQATYSTLFFWDGGWGWGRMGSSMCQSNSRHCGSCKTKWFGIFGGLGLLALEWFCHWALWMDFGSTQILCRNTQHTALCATRSLPLASSFFITWDSRLVLKKLSHGWRKHGSMFSLPLYVCRWDDKNPRPCRSHLHGLFSFPTAHLPAVLAQRRGRDTCLSATHSYLRNWNRSRIIMWTKIAVWALITVGHIIVKVIMIMVMFMK